MHRCRKICFTIRGDTNHHQIVNSRHKNTARMRFANCLSGVSFLMPPFAFALLQFAFAYLFHPINLKPTFLKLPDFPANSTATNCTIADLRANAQPAQSPRLLQSAPHGICENCS